MNNHRYILEPYNGMKSRYHCPACKHRQKTFSRYVDSITGEHLSPDVGRCNRENSCGYHYTPKQYFQDNNIDINSSNVPFVRSHTLRKPNERTKVKGMLKPSFIDPDVFKKSLTGYDRNTFTNYLTGLFGAETTAEIINRYKIGTSKHWPGATIFYQIDINGKTRAGKIMQYDISGHRVKKPYNLITWVHKVVKIYGYELNQCLFGEHLIKGNTLPIGVVESEKTACIASIYLPDFIWLACGQLNGLSVEKCKVLEGRTVVLFPDLNGFDKWQIKAIELQKELSGTRFIVSDYLQKNAPETDNGFDLADYLTRFDIKEFKQPDKPQWFVDSMGILQRYESGQISGNEYLDLLQKNFEESSLSGTEYVRQTNNLESNN